jgi:hypothetical protein
MHSSFPLGPRHRTIPQNQLNSFLAERKQIADRRFFCRMRLKKPSFRRTDFSPSWTHKSESLPNFGVNRVQPLMARDTLGYQYTGNGDSSQMPGDEIDDDDIVDRLGRIFKDMPTYTPCPVPEYSAACPPNEVSSRTQCRVLIM